MELILDFCSTAVWADTAESCLQLAAAAFKRLSPAYTVAFVIVRTLIGPPAITWLARRLVLTDRLPVALRCASWFSITVLLLLG